MTRRSRTAGGSPGVWHWRLDAGQCIGCGICADLCRSDAIVMTRAMALPEPVPGACVGCGDCERECPTDAISVLTIVDRPA